MCSSWIPPVLSPLPLPLIPPEEYHYIPPETFNRVWTKYPFPSKPNWPEKIQVYHAKLDAVMGTRGKELACVGIFVVEGYTNIPHVTFPSDMLDLPSDGSYVRHDKEYHHSAYLVSLGITPEPWMIPMVLAIRPIATLEY